MRATFRPLPAWPYPPQPIRAASYTTTYEETLWELQAEIEAIRGSEVVIGLVMTEADVRMDGMIKGNARPAYPGVELSFDTRKGRLTFHTDRHRGYVTRVAYHRERGSETVKRLLAAWQDNLRSIALGLEALRAVDRYGITTSSEQYAGFAMLTAGDDVERGRKLVEAAGGLTEALKQHHPDHGGQVEDFRAIVAFRQAQP